MPHRYCGITHGRCRFIDDDATNGNRCFLIITLRTRNGRTQRKKSEGCDFANWRFHNHSPAATFPSAVWPQTIIDVKKLPCRSRQTGIPVRMVVSLIGTLPVVRSTPSCWRSLCAFSTVPCWGKEQPSPICVPFTTSGLPADQTQIPLVQPPRRSRAALAGRGQQ